MIPARCHHRGSRGIIQTFVQGGLLCLAAGLDDAGGGPIGNTDTRQYHFAQLQAGLDGFRDNVAGPPGKQPRPVSPVTGARVDDQVRPVPARGLDHMFGGMWAVHGHHQCRGLTDTNLEQHIRPAGIAIKNTGARGTKVCDQVAIDVDPHMRNLLTI